MDSTRKHLEQQQVQGTGIAHDLKRLRSEGSASAAELREFLGQLKGRSPEEVMGVVAQSSLVQSLLTATAGFAIVLLVCTIGPYSWNLAFPTPEKSTPATASNTQSVESSAAPANEDTASANGAGGASGEVDLEGAAAAMGIGGAKEADPNENPLDKKLENLLDGVE